jgi:hypothetical protein
MYQDAIPRSGSRFGLSVSMANEIVVIGAPNDAVGTSNVNSGSVSIFDVFSGNNPLLEVCNAYLHNHAPMCVY